MNVFRICTLLLVALSVTPAYAAYWWEGNLNKEIPAVKKALSEAEGTLSATGYEDAKALIPLIKASLKENQTGGYNELRFVRLCALVYRGRNAPGIEKDEFYKSAKSHAQLVLGNWDRKVDSISFVRMCLLMRYEFSYEGPKAELDFIKKVRPHIKDDPVFDEALVRFMGFRYQSFGKDDILKEARKLVKQERAVYTNARTAGIAIQTVAFFNKDTKLLLEAAGLLENYISGMQTVDRNDKKRWIDHVAMLRETAKDWR